MKNRRLILALSIAAAAACSESRSGLLLDAQVDPGAPDASADLRAPDAALQPDASATDGAAEDATAPGPDAAVGDAAADALIDASPSDVSPDAGAAPGPDAGATCGPGASREMLCTTYCQGIAKVCTGGNAQYPTADACLAACRAPAWACGNPGETTGNSLFCRLAHMALAGVGPAAMECPRAGPGSAACQ